ncbi:leucine-rich repeat domain-containing protein [Dyadobacter sp. CY323]|uniref:leucine-rich repeat domain-containing protein n=1 Tax=Dyadobacter sp. CY323 TaxID=2907302 RepID=UPI001F16FBA7|nr:leucine-rich repeat domain-containing protein [Dyadobacter sp. CY323]MCE6991644.1 leucine-rich repeat domain-containing protein [Dyadobacter sp. CY323]
MKSICTLILSICFLQVHAQTRVAWSKDAAAKGIDIIKISNAYDGSSKESSKAIFDQVDKMAKIAFPVAPSTGIGLFLQVFVNASGETDYVIFDVQANEKYNQDSLRKLTENALFEHFNGFKVANPSGKAFQLTTVRNIGKQQFVRRDVKRSDSSVVDIKSALSVIDTLKIKYIYLNQLELQTVPDVIYRFRNAEELYLGGNELKTISIDMKRLPKLRQLHLQGNQIGNEGLKLTKNASLDLLNLKDNKLTNIPTAARKCKKLTALWLGGNALTELSSGSFRRLKQVRDLNFYRSDIAVLPKGIKKMKNLEVLDLYYNKLELLPESITKLKRLTHLAVSYNQLTALPAKINKLQKVHTLYAHHNHLSKLPKQIVEMQNLAILDLGYNWFTNFPAELISFTNLKELDLSSNNFPDFPEQLLKINKLDKLYLRGNPFVKENTEQKYSQQLGLLKSKNIEVFY